MKKACLTIIISILSLTMFAQTKVGDAILPNKLNAESSELLLNGSGIREKLWFDLYACGLYLQNKTTNGPQIATADQPMAIHMEILSSLLSKKKLLGALKSGIEKTNSKKTVLEITPKLNTFLNFIDNEISTGDKYRITYTPSTGTSLYVNDIKKGTIDGLNFKTAMFNIWLANDSVDNDLKKELLGS